VDPLGAGGFTRVTWGFIFLLPNRYLPEVHGDKRLNVLQNLAFTRRGWLWWCFWFFILVF
jgi:hypothetical protein